MTDRPGRAGREERGAAVVLVVAMAGVLLLVGGATGIVGALVTAHRRAQAAADLAALAGATSLAHHDGDPCAEARSVAKANGARLAECSVDGEDVVVAAVVIGPRWLGQDQDLTAEARAGPATRK